MSHTPPLRHGLLASLVVLAILAGAWLLPVPGLAMQPALQTQAPPSPTPVQVTPPPSVGAPGELPTRPPVTQDETEGTIELGPGWLLPLAGGILVWALAAVALLGILALLFWQARHRRRHRPTPPATPSIPFLKSSDGNLYFRLDRLDGEGLIVGRGKHGADLLIDESTPYADTVSARHARIYYDTICGHVIIEDLDSTNGVFINGRQAPRKNLLKDGWIVGIGKVNLIYHDGESDTGPLD